jgi:hypothetical protein
VGTINHQKANSRRKYAPSSVFHGNTNKMYTKNSGLVRTLSENVQTVNCLSLYIHSGIRTRCQLTHSSNFGIVFRESINFGFVLKHGDIIFM